MSAQTTNRDGRKALDEIVADMAEPGFITRHHRPPSVPETGAHVNADMLAVVAPRSRYVRRWRRHARHCLACANVFRYFGLPLD